MLRRVTILCLLAQSASAQIAYPAGEPIAFSLQSTAWTSTSLGQPNTMTDALAQDIAPGTTDIAFSGSVGPLSGNTITSIQPSGCIDSRTAYIYDDGPTPGTHGLDFYADSDSIDFEISSETRHQHIMDLNCCEFPSSLQSYTLSSATTVTTFTVPPGPASTFLRFNDLSVSTPPGVVNVATGPYTEIRRGRLRAELWLKLGPGSYFNVLDVNAADFAVSGSFDQQVDAGGTYVLILSYSETEVLNTSLECEILNVDLSYSESATVSIDAFTL